jgi:hypothetical protein
LSDAALLLDASACFSLYTCTTHVNCAAAAAAADAPGNEQGFMKQLVAELLNACLRIHPVLPDHTSSSGMRSAAAAAATPGNEQEFMKQLVAELLRAFAPIHPASPYLTHLPSACVLLLLLLLLQPRQATSRSS